MSKAEKPAIDYILGLYSRFPDKTEQQPQKYVDLRFASLEPITVKQLEQLKYYRERYGLLPSKIFNVVQEPPPGGLTRYMISNWLSGQSKSADPEQLKWVLDQCMAFEKFGQK